MNKELFNTLVILKKLDTTEKLYYSCEEELTKFEQSKLLSQMIKHFSLNIENMGNVRALIEFKFQNKTNSYFMVLQLVYFFMCAHQKNGIWSMSPIMWRAFWKQIIQQFWTYNFSNRGSQLSPTASILIRYPILYSNPIIVCDLKNTSWWVFATWLKSNRAPRAKKS